MSDLFKPAHRVRFVWPDGLCGACYHNAPNSIGTVVGAPTQDDSRIAVVYDGDDYISYSLTECLHHIYPSECATHSREVHTPFHGKHDEPITYRPDEIPKT